MPNIAPTWVPPSDALSKTNAGRFAKARGYRTFEELHGWSIRERDTFWRSMIEELGIPFHRQCSEVRAAESDLRSPEWLPGARINIAEACFLAPQDATALLWRNEGGRELNRVSYGELKAHSYAVAERLRAHGFNPGDAIAIAMTMTAESVFIYLGIVLSGCSVVSIADSFAPDEIATRLRISKAKGIFTQDWIIRGGKKLPMYQKIVDAKSPRAIVLPSTTQTPPHAVDPVTLRANDLSWNDFLKADVPKTPSESTFHATTCSPADTTNILFSSGTTGDPKAIPWSHTTPIKCAVDGFFHHDIQPGDVVAWPTNLGWMMGPWLIYATLVNRGTIALYTGAPTGRDFGEFVQDARVNMLGLVPSLVKAWRNSDCMKGLDWSAIKLLSSTGECSNADDYAWVMSLAGNKPVIEYCGGTEIGGGYLTGSLLQPAWPATFTTPAMGLSFYILDEAGKPADNGELFIVPPSIGLSNTLLNKDHNEVYFSDAPKGPHGELLRRHGDQVERLPNGTYRAHGRADDTMNLGGIKVSSAEIERVLNQTEGVSETAAIAVNPPGGGPSLLVVFMVATPGLRETIRPGKLEDQNPKLFSALQKNIKEKLNPLFKIHDVVVTDSLPRTASNKVMRRVLRGQYRA